MQTTDLTQQITELEIPVYFFHGKYDYTCSYPLAKDYFEKLKAPLKGFYTFEQSAHSPIFEEPEKTIKILQEDVLAGTNNLADTKKAHIVLKKEEKGLEYMPVQGGCLFFHPLLW